MYIDNELIKELYYVCVFTINFNNVASNCGFIE